MTRICDRSDAVRFRSRIDLWMVVVVLIAVATILAGVGTAFLAVPGAHRALAVLIALPGLVLPLWFLSSTHYTFEGGELIVRSGPLKWRIPLSEVRKIERTRSPLSSPALSLDRLRIDYGKHRSIMVSPRDQAGFLREIEVRRARV